MYISQHIVCGTRIKLVYPPVVRRSFGAYAKPLLIHIVFSLHVVEQISAVAPRSLGIVYIQIGRLP